MSWGNFVHTFTRVVSPRGENRSARDHKILQTPPQQPRKYDYDYDGIPIDNLKHTPIYYSLPNRKCFGVLWEEVEGLTIEQADQLIKNREERRFRPNWVWEGGEWIKNLPYPDIPCPYQGIRLLNILEPDFNDPSFFCSGCKGSCTDEYIFYDYIIAGW